MDKLEEVLALVKQRAEDNLKRWGDHPRTDTLWLMIFIEEVGEVGKALLDGTASDLLNELLDCAAVAVEWIADRTEKAGA